MKKTMMTSMILTAALATSVRAADFTAGSYVQEGLVGLWDAEENAGWGVHQSEPEVWKNLVDGSVSGRVEDFILDGAGTFEAKGFRKTGEGVMAHNSETVTDARFKTIEVVVSDIPASGWAVPFYVTNRQMIAVSDNSLEGHRRVMTCYWNGKGGLNTVKKPKVQSISVQYYVNGSGVLTAKNPIFGGERGEEDNWGNEPRTTTMAVGGLTVSTDFRNVTGYCVHSIRLYDRELTDVERQRNLYVDGNRFGAAVYALDSLDCTWTGAAGDGKFANAGNWLDGWGPMSGVTMGNLVLTAHGDTTVENDLGEIRMKGLRVSQADDATKAVTVNGDPIVLASAVDDDKTQAALQARCPLTVNADVTYAGTKSAQYYETGIVYNGTVTIEATGSHKFWSVSDASLSTAFNKAVIAPQAELKTGSKHQVNFYGPVTARLLSPGTAYGGSEAFIFHATGNSWESVPLIYGVVVADGDGTLPSDLVFRWQENGGKDYPDEGSHCYRLRGDQTCDRIESKAVVSSAGVIRWRNRIYSDTKDVTLTLRGTASATSYGALVSESGMKLNIVWEPVGDFTQTIADIRQSMIGEIVVKGGTFASAGTNNFPNVTAVRVADGAAFAVTASGYNGAANPFPGKTDLWISGSGKVSVPAGVTATFSSGLVCGVLQPADTYQALDGTDATAKKVGWIVGEGLVTIAACDGTSWKDATASGDWNDPANWSNGLPDPAKPVYLTAEGGSYAVTMKNGDVWPKNLVIRGANAKLVVGAGQTVAFDGSSVTASVSIEEGGTLSVAGSLTLTGFGGTFTIGSTSSATSLLEIVAGGSFFYTPRYQVSYPISVNVGGAVDVAGGVLTVPAGGDLSSALKLNGGTLLSSGAGEVAVGPYQLDPKEDWAPLTFRAGRVDIAGRSVLKRRGTGTSNVTYGPSKAGETLLVSIRENAVYALNTDGLVLGSPNTTTCVSFDSSSTEHSCFGYRVRVRAEGETGVAELRVSNGKVWNDGRGLDIADDNKADVVTHGRLVQTGGWIYNNASNGGWTDQGKQNGFTVGYGANAPGTAGCVAFGEMLLSGGTNQNVNGVTLVGTGYGEGTVVQTGGFNGHDSTTQAFGIGVAGGHGRWTVSNGTLRVKADAYIGGFSSNILTKAEAMTRWPDARHDAEGTLAAAGGTVEFQKNLVLGADGCGTVDVIGSSGMFTVGGDLVFSNHVANAQSGGTVNFVFDADGIRPLTVNGKAKFRPGAKMTVDVSGYAGTRSKWLLKTVGGFENPIAPGDVEIRGATGTLKDAVVRRTENAYRMVVPCGACLIVR